MTFINPQGENAIDFPCSYVWRAYYEETFYGKYLPHIEPQEKPEKIGAVAPNIIEHRVIKTHDKQLTQKVLENERAIKYLLGKQKEPRKIKY